MTESERQREIKRIKCAIVLAQHDIQLIRKKLKASEIEYNKYVRQELRKLENIRRWELKLGALREGVR